MITVWKGQSANHKLNFNLFIIKVTLLIIDFTLRPCSISQWLCSLAPPSTGLRGGAGAGTPCVVMCPSPGRLVPSTGTGRTAGDPQLPPAQRWCWQSGTSSRAPRPPRGSPPPGALSRQPPAPRPCPSRRNAVPRSPQ